MSADLVTLDGPLTIAAIAGRHAELGAPLAEGAQRLDLSGVTECDAAGVQLLVAARRCAAAAGRPLRLVSASPVVAEALRCCGVVFDA